MTKKVPDAYSALADWFEYLNDDCGYEEWSQYLLKKLAQLLPQGANGVDIGCGSGYFTRELKKNGYLVTGMDLSSEMLVKADELAQKEGLKIPFVCADVSSFRLMEKVDFAVAVNDCFNYVKKEKILSAFKKVYAAIKKGGYFLFDISSENKLTKKVADNVSVDDREEVTYLSVNSREGEKVTMDVTLFVKRKDGLFTRFDEQHLLYIYTESEIVSLLQEAKFTVKEVTGHLGEDKTQSDRIEFVCQKE